MKFAVYGLMSQLEAVLKPLESVGILGAARFMVRRALKRADTDSPDALRSAFESFVDLSSELEPTAEEIELATEMEELANQALVELDSGESQLCAIAIVRGLDAVITGDKRAIQAAEVISETFAALSILFGKLVCLEQLMLGVIQLAGFGEIRSRVCASRTVDTALSICFKCWSPENANLSAIQQALESYIESLRGDASRLLCPGSVFPNS